jgi:hypothetical protein
MRAERLDDADAAVGIAEGHQVLAQELDPNRRTIGFGEFLWQQGWQPEAAQQLAHRRARVGLGDQRVVFSAQHDDVRGSRQSKKSGTAHHWQARVWFHPPTCTTV